MYNTYSASTRSRVRDPDVATYTTDDPSRPTEHVITEAFSRLIIPMRNSSATAHTPCQHRRRTYSEYSSERPIRKTSENRTVDYNRVGSSRETRFGLLRVLISRPSCPGRRALYKRLSRAQYRLEFRFASSAAREPGERPQGVVVAADANTRYCTVASRHNISMCISCRTSRLFLMLNTVLAANT